MKKAIGLSVVLLIVGLIGFKFYQTHNPKAKEELATVVQEASLSQPTPVTEVRNSTQIEVTVPVNPVRKGVVEIGASGFNSFVVDIDKDKNWELVDKKFGKSGAYEGFLSTDDVWNQLKSYILSMTSDFAVNGNNVHFVVSSGANKNPKTALIIQAIKEKSKMPNGRSYVVNQVTADEEGKDALRALVPKEYRDRAFSVDIGSGNTKISWYQGTSMKSLESYGAKYAQNGTSAEIVKAEIMKLVQQIPESQRKFCFIIGGVPHELAEKTRQGDERFTTLQAPDYYSADNEKTKAGLNIYKGIIEGAGTENVVFDWNANFTIGFLLTLN